MKTVKISEQKLKGLERDATRYRFLRRENPGCDIFILQEAWPEDGKVVLGECDRAVDAAMKAKQNS